VRRSGTLALAAAALAALALVSQAALPQAGAPVRAVGVGDASWTPSSSSTTTEPSSFITRDDSITYRTEAVWNDAQVQGLTRYEREGLRYTHEINDRSGRLNATGFWATNLPDPSYDRDDDDGDRRWEEAEVIVGSQGPAAGITYTSMVQYSRWHPKRQRGVCGWAWDRRLGRAEVLSQLSRHLLGEWQAARYTLNYDSEDYPRVDPRPELPDPAPKARCSDARPTGDQHGFVVTFARPIAWEAFLALPGAGSSKWTAFEAIGRGENDELIWTCGGPVMRKVGTEPCESLGVDLDGVVAAVGYLDDIAHRAARDHADVARVDGLQDSLTGLLLDVGGFGVERPGLTVNDRYWELFLTE
jgi:hypothetical protein